MENSMGNPWKIHGKSMDNKNGKKEMFPWYSMGPHGGPWGPMGPHEESWVPMGSHGFPWVPMGPHGDPWSTTETFPFVPFLLSIDFPWFFHGFSMRFSMDFPWIDFPWIFHELQNVSVVVSGTPPGVRKQSRHRHLYASWSPILYEFGGVIRGMACPLLSPSCIKLRDGSSTAPAVGSGSDSISISSRYPCSA